MAAQESLAAAKLTVSKAREATEKYQSALTEKDAELKALQKELNALVRGLLASPRKPAHSHATTLTIHLHSQNAHGTPG